MVRSFHRPKRRRFAGVGALAVAAGFGVFAAVALATAASKPANTSPPTTSGQAQEGQTLKADPGTWSGTKPIDFSYQWRRCDTRGANCANLSAATDQIYTVSSDDVGRTLRVLVTAANGEGADTASSNQTGVVTKAPAQAPRNTGEPTLEGTAEQDQTLTANPGSWSGTQPIELAFRWRRCDANGGACADTAVTARMYRLGVDDVGKTLRVLVTASNSAGSSAAISDATAVVQGTTPPPGQCLSITRVALPERLVVDQIQFQPSRIHSGDEPLTARFHVVTTRGFCVSGALVYAVGVPFDRLSAEPEAQTGPDGWAQITFRILLTFRLKSGNFVVVFVRARKGGENLLAGVSTRRLVSVRVA